MANYNFNTHNHNNTNDKEPVFSRTKMIVGWIWLTKGGFWRADSVLDTGLVKSVGFDDKQSAINFCLKKEI